MKLLLLSLLLQTTQTGESYQGMDPITRTYILIGSILAAILIMRIIMYLAKNTNRQGTAPIINATSYGLTHKNKKAPESLLTPNEEYLLRTFDELTTLHKQNTELYRLAKAFKETANNTVDSVTMNRLTRLTQHILNTTNQADIEIGSTLEFLNEQLKSNNLIPH